jgi:hypothetical protein
MLVTKGTHTLGATSLVLLNCYRPVIRHLSEVPIIASNTSLVPTHSSFPFHPSPPPKGTRFLLLMGKTQGQPKDIQIQT